MLPLIRTPVSLRLQSCMSADGGGWSKLSTDIPLHEPNPELADSNIDNVWLSNIITIKFYVSIVDTKSCIYAQLESLMTFFPPRTW